MPQLSGNEPILGLNMSSLAYDQSSASMPSSLPNFFVSDPTLVLIQMMTMRMKIHLHLPTFL
jgi:hypothetical protein